MSASLGFVFCNGSYPTRSYAFQTTKMRIPSIHTRRSTVREIIVQQFRIHRNVHQRCRNFIGPQWKVPRCPRMVHGEAIVLDHVLGYMAIVERHFILDPRPTNIVGTTAPVVDKGHDPWLDGNGQWTLRTIFATNTSQFLQSSYGPMK
jgi:hypothetical protein